MNKRTKQMQGITLIALVVTIVVLLILAGVSIALLAGENGIINQAQAAKENTINAEAEEAEKLQSLNDQINEWTGNSTGKTLVQAFKDGEIKEGDFVNYTPIKGKTLANPLTKEDTGYDGEQNFTVEENTKWIVLGLDETGTQLLLTSASPLKTALGLGGAEGYINGKNVLDEVCSIYKNNYAKEARSMTLEDLNRYLGIMFDEETNKLYKIEDTQKKEPIEVDDLLVTGVEYKYKGGDYAPENYVKDVYKTNEKYQKLTKKQSNDKIKTTMYMYNIENVITEDNDRMPVIEMLLGDTDINGEGSGVLPCWLASPSIGGSDEVGYGAGMGAVVEGMIGGTPLFYTDGMCVSGKLLVRPIICLNSKTTVNDIQVISETKDKIDFSELDIEIDPEPEQLTGEEGMIEPVTKTITLVFENAWSPTESGEIGTFEVEEGETIDEVIERIQNFNGYIIQVSGGWINITLPSGKGYGSCSLSWRENDNRDGNVLGLPCILDGEYVIAVQPT